MIVKGRPAVIAYSCRSRVDGSYLYTTLQAQSIYAYGYDTDEYGTTSSTSLFTTSSRGSQQGIDLLFINDTNHECIVITGTASDDGYIGPIVLYPVDASIISNSGSGSNAEAVAEAVWNYGDNDVGARQHFRTLVGGSYNGTQHPSATPIEAELENIAEKVWTYGNAVNPTKFRTLTGGTYNNTVYEAIPHEEFISVVLDAPAANHNTANSIGHVINSGGVASLTLTDQDYTGIANAVLNTTTQVYSQPTNTIGYSVYAAANMQASNVVLDESALTSIANKILDTPSTGHTTANTIGGSVYAAANGTVVNDPNGTTIDTTALNSSITTLNQAITNLGTISSNLNSIHMVLSTDTSNILSSINGIPGNIWTYPITVDNYTKDPFQYISDTVWGRSGSDSTSRKLTSNKLANSEDELALSSEVNVTLNSQDIQLTIPDEEDIAEAVWNYGKNSGVARITERSLSTQSVIPATGTVSETLAVTSDLSNLTVINNLTELLTKVYGVLCHWKEEGDSIVVYNDKNDVLLTIPTEKNKYGDIVKMGSIPTEA